MIEDAKLAGYLLDVTHPQGGPKARFFLAHGFPETLRAALIVHSAAQPVAAVQSSPYGPRYAVVGPMTLPDGSVRQVRAVWQVDNGTDFPRLITAHPDE